MGSEFDLTPRYHVLAYYPCAATLVVLFYLASVFLDPSLLAATCLS